jgi:hypothetical protein
MVLILISILVLTAAASFALGYGVRDAISRHRHDAANGHPIICDKEHTFGLIGPQDVTLTAADNPKFKPVSASAENESSTSAVAA